MNLSVLIEVAISLCFIYLLLAIVCSGLGEWWATRRSLRARFLRRGLVNLLPDQWSYLRLVHHPMLRGFLGDAPGKPQLPSYLPPAEFARALVDVVIAKANVARAQPQSTDPAPASIEQFASALKVLRERSDPLASVLAPLLDRAGGELDVLFRSVESWYTASMDRVTGWYKRRTKRNLFVIALAIAVLGNVDSFALYRYLSTTPEVRGAVVVAAQRYLDEHKDAPDTAKATPSEAQFKATVERLASLERGGIPIGFSCLSSPITSSDMQMVKMLSGCWANTRQSVAGTGSMALKVLGWILTALLVSFGAPFWFDLLNKFMPLRSSGPKPTARSDTSKLPA